MAQFVKMALGEKEQIFRMDCQKFLVVLCSQMKRRFTFEEDSVLAILRILDPEEVLSPRRRMQSLAKLDLSFPTLVKEDDLDSLDEQWRDLLYFKESLKNISNSPKKFWFELRDVKDGNNQPKFQILSRLMCSLLALPHSSACVERVFSHINRIKNKDTNRLLVSTVANRILARQAITRQEGSCQTYEPSSSLVEDIKMGQCHKRYMQREDARKNENIATLHPGNAEAYNEDLGDEPFQVFLQ